MKLIKIICVDNGKTKQAEILQRSAKYLKVVIVNTTVTVELFKQDFQDRNYHGQSGQLTFTSTGE